MKKRYLPLTFVFAFALGLTTHSALCMKGEEEKREIRLVKFQKLEKEYDEELKKNWNQELNPPILNIPYLFGDPSDPLGRSTNKLLILNQNIKKLKEKLDQN
jgi:hypothetical protein